MFIDQATITIKAGNGGNGSVSFRREKFAPKGGPDGGTGGNGGHIILKVNSQLHTLLDQRYKRQYKAKNGEPGSSSRKDGKTGSDTIIELPIGTIVKDVNTNEILVDLVDSQQEFIIARGGKGGRGNAEFATPTQQAPRFAEEGTPGEEKIILLELKLLADVGLIGAPNAGKSTLLSVISAAHPKIADYPFTTLEPNLGIVKYTDHSFTVADIPGIIEGAHEGKGLGLQFLRHIERTSVLVLLIDSMSSDYHVEYKSISDELVLFSSELSNKPMIIAISKCDTEDSDVLLKIKELKKLSTNKIIPISSVSGIGIQRLLQALWKEISKSN